MKDKESAHKKVQEMIDCYADTEFLKEMSEIDLEKDEEEAAIKWIALAALHGVNENAKKIVLHRDADGTVKVTAKYRKAQLPAPKADIGRRIVEALRNVTHLEGRKAKTQLALGMRDGSIDLDVEIEAESGGESVTLKFPK